MTARLRSTVGDSQTLLILVLLVLVVGLLGSGADSILQRTITTDLVLLVAVVGFYIFVGNSGVFSFGHAAFMAIGAYVAAIAAFPAEQQALLLPDLPGVLELHLSPFASSVAGGLVAAAVGGLLAVPLSRLAGIAASLTTFAVLGIVHVVVSHLDAVTNGVSGISGVPTTTSLGSAVGWCVAALVAAWVFQRSARGRRLQASREDEVAARSIGIGVRGERRVAFVLSAFFVGVAGGLYVQLLGNLTPDTVYLDVTFLIVVMLVVGGVNSLSGAVVGTIVISTVSEVLRRFEEGAHVGPVWLHGAAGMREVGLALIMLAVLILRPQGLVAGRELRLPWRWSLRAGRNPTPDVSASPTDATASEVTG